jgi:sulfite reductase beta subunit-like hemoprotein
MFIAAVGCEAIRVARDILGAREVVMACPALPTCGLALAESERMLPSIVTDIDAVLARYGLANEPVTIRMTGCPNGCARPYMGEIGIVGVSADRYALYLGEMRPRRGSTACIAKAFAPPKSPTYSPRSSPAGPTSAPPTNHSAISACARLGKKSPRDADEPDAMNFRQG